MRLLIRAGLQRVTSAINRGVSPPSRLASLVIVPRSSPKLAALKQFLDYAVTGGQKYAAALDFAPLPQSIQQKAQTQLGSIQIG